MPYSDDKSSEVKYSTVFLMNHNLCMSKYNLELGSMPERDVDYIK